MEGENKPINELEAVQASIRDVLTEGSKSIPSDPDVTFRKVKLDETHLGKLKALGHLGLAGVGAATAAGGAFSTGVYGAAAARVSNKGLRKKAALGAAGSALMGHMGATYAHSQWQKAKQAWHDGKAVDKNENEAESNIVPRRSLMVDALDGKPIAEQLVEFAVSSMGYDQQATNAISNAARIAALEPPEINDIQDLADTIDWRLLKKGISTEHIETQIQKDGKILVFLDDRAKPKMETVKEILANFGTVSVLQKASDRNEETKTVEGYYAVQLEPLGLDGLQAAHNATTDQKDSDDKLNDIRGPNITPGPGLATRGESVEDNRIEDEIKGEAQALLSDFVYSAYEPFCSSCGYLLEGEAPKDFRAVQVDRASRFERIEKLVGMPLTEHESMEATSAADMAYILGVQAGRRSAKSCYNELAERMTTGGPKPDTMARIQALGKDVESVKAKATAERQRKLMALQQKRNEKTSSAVAKLSQMKKQEEIGHPWLHGHGTLAEAFKIGYRLGFTTYVEALKNRKKKMQGSDCESIEPISIVWPALSPLQVACKHCATPGTKLDEYKFNGLYCAHHGSRLDKYSRSCYECEGEDPEPTPNGKTLCPSCLSETTANDAACPVCGVEFDDGEMSYAEHLASTEFADIPEAEAPEGWGLSVGGKKKVPPKAISAAAAKGHEGPKAKVDVGPSNVVRGRAQYYEPKKESEDSAGETETFRGLAEFIAERYPQLTEQEQQGLLAKAKGLLMKYGGHIKNIWNAFRGKGGAQAPAQPTAPATQTAPAPAAPAATPAAAPPAAPAPAAPGPAPQPQALAPPVAQQPAGKPPQAGRPGMAYRAGAALGRVSSFVRGGVQRVAAAMPARAPAQAPAAPGRAAPNRNYLATRQSLASRAQQARRPLAASLDPVDDLLTIAEAEGFVFESEEDVYNFLEFVYDLSENFLTE